MKFFKKQLFIFILAIIILSILSFYLYSSINDIYYNTALYPPIKPLNTNFIQVSEIHTVFYSTYGNPNGQPILFVHGGPGTPTTENSPRFFNPNYYFIILIDQRGCGKSTPSGELRENTTQYLIEDFEKIRKILNIKKWYLFGGSWGSTLSLAYAITHPQVISGMILRGIFFATPEEIEWLFGSNNLGGPAKFLPAFWNYFIDTLPIKNKNTFNGNYLEEYYKCFNGEFGQEKRDECLISWGVLGNSLLELKSETLQQEIKNTLKTNYIQRALIANYYYLNYCFLEPNYFFKNENIQKIKDIPTIIVQGKYDLICPPKAAYTLNSLLNNSKLYITLAGHSMYDNENIKYLIKATDSFI